jgi:hypothetical protein
VDKDKLQGWSADPFELHEVRYFSAGRPTKLVRDGDVESYDDPPSEESWSSAAAVAATGLGGGAASRAGSAQIGSETAGGGKTPYLRDIDVASPAPKKRRRVALASTAAIAVGAVVLYIAAGSGSGSTPSTRTEASVYAATVKENSADVRVIYAFTTGSRKFGATATESGPVSWSADQGELTMTMAAAGEFTLVMRQIIDGRDTYSKASKISVKGLPARALAEVRGMVLTGWTESTWSGRSPASLSGLFFIEGLLSPAGLASGLSPSSLLGLLRAQASSVQNLGGEVVDGIHTVHYRALIPLSRLGAGTAAELHQVERLLGTSFLGVDYWIDSSELLRQLRLAVTVPRPPRAETSAPGELTLPITYPITMSLSLRLSNYGTPVHVVPPPPAEITSRQSCVASADGFSCQ